MKSFSSRLAALERLEAEHEAQANPGDLTDADCATLLFQVALSNVRMEDGRAVRSWQCGGDAVNVAIDTALLRLNALLRIEPGGPRTSHELAFVLAQYVPDEALPGWVWGVLFEKFPIEEATHEEL